MNSIKAFPGLTGAFLFISALSVWAEGSGIPLRPCEVLRITGGSSSRIQLSGSSNVQDWRVESHVLRVDGEEEISLNHLARLNAKASPGNRSGQEYENGTAMIQLSIPVKSLEAPNRRMLRDLKTAVGHPQYPEILYQLIQAEPQKGTDATWQVRGVVTVAGQEHEVVHLIKARPVEDNGWNVSGTLELKMTWFGISPPRALIGLVRAHDGFNVDFDIHVHTVCTVLAGRTPDNH